ncbi:MAG: molybdenum cofactor biosynthesis protein MoaE [Gammaproteobacteria bacterium]
MKVEIFNKLYDPWLEAKQYQDDCLEKGKYGAMTLFVGTMRDLNEGDAVTSMTLEHYPEMTQKHLEQIVGDAIKKFDVIDVLLMHRVEQVFPNDPIVCVAVWSAHRAAAYDANRFIMEDLKDKAPFWKKETIENDDEAKQRWVEKNSTA